MDSMLRALNDTSRQPQFPTSGSGKRWVRGYHKELPSRFSADLLLAELKQAVG